MRIAEQNFQQLLAIAGLNGWSSQRAVADLFDRAAGYAGRVAAFCHKMGYSQLELLIAKFQVSTFVDQD